MVQITIKVRHVDALVHRRAEKEKRKATAHAVLSNKHTQSRQTNKQTHEERILIGALSKRSEQLISNGCLSQLLSARGNDRPGKISVSLMRRRKRMAKIEEIDFLPFLSLSRRWSVCLTLMTTGKRKRKKRSSRLEKSLDEVVWAPWQEQQKDYKSNFAFILSPWFPRRKCRMICICCRCCFSSLSSSVQSTYIETISVGSRTSVVNELVSI